MHFAVIVSSIGEINEEDLSLCRAEKAVISILLLGLGFEGSIPLRETLWAMEVNSSNLQRDWYFLPIQQHVEQISPQQLLMNKLDELFTSLATADGLIVD